MTLLNQMTFDNIDFLLAELPADVQLKLAARICERQSKREPTEEEKKQAVEANRARVQAWLTACDAVAESIEGEFDSARDIREIREERIGKL